MHEINLNYLKSSESYLQLSAKYFNKIDRIEKDLEKRIYDLDQMLTTELEKINADSKLKNESRTSRLKQLAKKTIRFPFSRSSYSPNSLSHSSSIPTLNNENYELNNTILSIKKKYVKQMMDNYIEAFKEIYKLKVESIEPVSFI